MYLRLGALTVHNTDSLVGALSPVNHRELLQGYHNDYNNNNDINNNNNNMNNNLLLLTFLA